MSSLLAFRKVTIKAVPTRQQVAQFLNDFKATVTLGFVRWLPRPAERQHVIDFGISQNQALEFIRRLTPANYSKGPDPDDLNPNREVWVFGCDIAGTEVYIKLAMQPDNKKRNVLHGLIWSFHPADHPMNYPLC